MDLFSVQILIFNFQNRVPESSRNSSPAKQRLRIILDTRHRGGKTVTAIIGFSG